MMNLIEGLIIFSRKLLFTVSVHATYPIISKVVGLIPYPIPVNNIKDL